MPGHPPYIRNLLLWRTEWMEARVVEAARRNGDAYLTPAMSRMFGYIARGPIGVSDLARHLGISRQGVHKLALEAARLELVELVDDPGDRRVKLLRFSTKGHEMSVAAVKAFDAIEDEMKMRLGERDLEELRRLLAKGWGRAE